MAKQAMAPARGRACRCGAGASLTQHFSREKKQMDRGLRRWATVACIFILAVAGLSAGQGGAWAATSRAGAAKGGNTGQPAAWPSYGEQLQRDAIAPDSALAKLIAKNQDFGLLRPAELKDSLRIPFWLRVLYRKNHPEEQARPGDPTG